MMNPILKPIGVIHSPFREAPGTPIQPGRAGCAEGTVEVFPEYEAGLKDLNGFERIWLIYWFDRARPAALTVVPYLDTREHGTFATRSPARPNPVGMSNVVLIKVERNILTVGDLDVLDSTPLLDIKPYVPEFDSFPVSRRGWFDEVRGPERDTVTADDRFARK